MSLPHDILFSRFIYQIPVCNVSFLWETLIYLIWCVNKILLKNYGGIAKQMQKLTAKVNKMWATDRYHQSISRNCFAFWPNTCKRHNSSVLCLRKDHPYDYPKNKTLNKTKYTVSWDNNLGVTQEAMKHLRRHSIVLALHYFQGMACYRSATLLEVMESWSLETNFSLETQTGEVVFLKYIQHFMFLNE